MTQLELLHRVIEVFEELDIPYMIVGSFASGVYGYACDGAEGNYGVYGHACSGQGNYAGYFDGDAMVTGILEVAEQLDVLNDLDVSNDATVGGILHAGFHFAGQPALTVRPRHLVACRSHAPFQRSYHATLAGERIGNPAHGVRYCAGGAAGQRRKLALEVVYRRLKLRVRRG